MSNKEMPVPTATEQAQTEGTVISGTHYNADPAQMQARFMPYDSDFSDAGNAAKFAALRKADVCFTKGMGWLVWNGKYWEASEPQARLAVDDFTADMRKEARSRYLEAEGVYKRLETAETPDLGELKRAREAVTATRAYFTHAQRSRDAYRINAALKLAEPRLEKPDELFDKDWYMLNTPSGVIDLRTGQTLKHNPVFYQTKITAVSPSNQGKRILTEHLQRVSCGDGEFIEGLQVLYGSSLFGKVFQKGAHFQHGGGHNAKTATLLAFSMTLGGYAGGFDIHLLTDAFSARDFTRDAVSFRGRRLMTAEELEPGKKLSTSALKVITSEGQIHSRALYCEPVDFLPTHSVIVSTNHLPIVREFDAATWDRIFVWPFRAVIEGADAVENYGSYLFEHCGGAFLEWAIEGAAKFAANNFKLKIPRCVEEATANYRRNQVWVSPFLKSEFVENAPDGKAGTDELYHAYEAWARDNGEEVNGPKAFAQAMKAAGYASARVGTTRGFRGIRLADKPDTPDEIEIL